MKNAKANFIKVPARIEPDLSGYSDAQKSLINRFLDIQRHFLGMKYYQNLEPAKGFDSLKSEIDWLAKNEMALLNPFEYFYKGGKIK